MSVARITGPLRTWYDLHEALAHEITALADRGLDLEPATQETFRTRFTMFEQELRNHSEVEDGIMFPAVRARGGVIEAHLTQDHHDEQERIYDTRCLLIEAAALHVPSCVRGVNDALKRLRDALQEHFAAEEEHVLPLVADLFDDTEQAALLGTIIGCLPPDPHLQPWVAAALTPEHREARLRNMAHALPRDALVTVLTQIRDGVAPAVWADIVARLPELAGVVDQTESS